MFKRMGFMVALTISGAATAASIVNDGFENPVTAAYTPYDVAQVIGSGGWRVTQGTVDVVRGGLNWGSAYEGSQFLDLVGTGPGSNLGAIEQTVSGLAANGAYQLTFWYRANAGDPLLAGSTYDAQIAVVTTNATPAVIHVNAAQADTWQSYSYIFSPTSSTATISFAALSSGTHNNGGVFLDAVSLAPVPEPSEWAMLAVGFGFVGMAAARRRSQRADR